MLNERDVRDTWTTITKECQWCSAVTDYHLDNEDDLLPVRLGDLDSSRNSDTQSVRPLVTTRRLPLELAPGG